MREEDALATAGGTFRLRSGQAAGATIALRWETHATAGDGLRSDCGDYEEVAQDGDRRGLSQIAFDRRGDRVRSLSFWTRVSGLGRDHLAGWRTGALADYCGVVAKGRIPAHGRLSPIWRSGSGGRRGPSPTGWSGRGRAGSGDDLSSDRGFPRYSGEGSHRSRPAFARHALGSQIHRKDYDRRSTNRIEGEPSRGSDCQ